jgi:hypothetical protein
LAQGEAMTPRTDLIARLEADKPDWLDDLTAETIRKIRAAFRPRRIIAILKAKEASHDQA